MPVFKGSQIPYPTISKIEKIGGKSNKQEFTYLIEIYTKDLRHIRFSFIPGRCTRGRIFKSLREDRTQAHQFFCYSYKEPLADNMIDGWNVYDPLREYTRQGCFKSGSQWRLTNVNED